MGGHRRMAQGCLQGPLDLLGLSSSRFPRTSAGSGALVLGFAERGLKGLKGALGDELQLLKGKFKGPHMEMTCNPPTLTCIKLSSGRD